MSSVIILVSAVRMALGVRLVRKGIKSIILILLFKIIVIRDLGIAVRKYVAMAYDMINNVMMEISTVEMAVLNNAKNNQIGYVKEVHHLQKINAKN